MHLFLIAIIADIALALGFAIVIRRMIRSIRANSGVYIADGELDDQDDYAQARWSDPVSDDDGFFGQDRYAMGYFNPSSGLPMLPDSAVDTGGNLFGTDWSDETFSQSGDFGSDFGNSSGFNDW